MTERAAATTRDFHEGTKLGDGPRTRPSLLMPEGFTPMDMANRPTAFKRYPDAPRIALPQEVGESGLAAASVLSGEAAGASTELDSTLLARLLFYSAGVSRAEPHRRGARLGSTRRAASATSTGTQEACWRRHSRLPTAPASPRVSIWPEMSGFAPSVIERFKARFERDDS